MSFNAIRENKILAKISGYTVALQISILHQLLLLLLLIIIIIIKPRRLISHNVAFGQV